MTEKPVDPWFNQVLKKVGASPVPLPGEEDATRGIQSGVSSDVRQQTLADLYEEWAESVPAENRAEYLKLCNRLRHLTHDTNDPLALILYTIGTSNKIHLLLPHKIQQQCQTVIHDLDSSIDKIRGLHNQAIDKLNQTQIKLATEYSTLCELTVLRAKEALNTHQQSVDERGRKLYAVLDQQINSLKKLQKELVEGLSQLLANPIEQSNNNEALLKHIHEVVARIDVLFHKTYQTILLTFVAFIVAAFIAGIFIRPYL